MNESCTYLLGGDHNTDLLNSVGELVGLNTAGVVEIEVLETLVENLLLGLNSRSFLLQLGFEFSFETKGSEATLYSSHGQCTEMQTGAIEIELNTYLALRPSIVYLLGAYFL